MGATAVDNATKTRRYFDALWNQRDYSVIEDWVTRDYVGHYTSRPEPIRGIDGFRSMADELFVAFPDLHMEIEDSIANEDTVVSRVTMSGTHQGEMLGYAPTGLRIAAGFVAIEHYVDGLCAEEWVYSDDLGLARQIKALPEPGSRGERFGIALHGLSARRFRKRSGR